MYKLKKEKKNRKEKKEKKTWTKDQHRKERNNNRKKKKNSRVFAFVTPAAAVANVFVDNSRIFSLSLTHIHCRRSYKKFGYNLINQNSPNEWDLLLKLSDIIFGTIRGLIYYRKSFQILEQFVLGKHFPKICRWIIAI